MPEQGCCRRLVAASPGSTALPLFILPLFILPLFALDHRHFMPAHRFLSALCAALFAAFASGALPFAAAQAQEGAQQGAAQSVELSSAQLFAFAATARDAGDYEAAEAAFRALAADPAVEIRNEARFRLALMLDGQGRTREGAVLLREILDEQPASARVRVELARMQAMMGNMRAAERELRAAEAAGLPPDVEQLVRFFVSALSSRRPFGASFELALAPDTNVNRATRSDTLGTIIGDFELDEDAQARSGVGLAARSQLWARLPASGNVDLRGEVKAGASLYRDGQFDDYALGLEAGPQIRLGTDRLNLSAIVSWRWYGGVPYSISWGAEGSFQHRLGDTQQLRLDLTVLSSKDRLNSLRDAERVALSAGIDKAFSARFGGGLRLSGQRQLARDPGYSAASGGPSAYAFREFGQTTAVVTLGYQHLEADKRLSLYPRRRVDERIDASLSATFRALKIGSLAPVMRLRFERNWSTVEIFDYRRLAAEFGVTAAF